MANLRIICILQIRISHGNCRLELSEAFASVHCSGAPERAMFVFIYLTKHNRIPIMRSDREQALPATSQLREAPIRRASASLPSVIQDMCCGTFLRARSCNGRHTGVDLSIQRFIVGSLARSTSDSYVYCVCIPTTQTDGPADIQDEIRPNQM